jgi:hypothetical protein
MSSYFGLQDFTSRLLVRITAFFSGGNVEKKPNTCSEGILCRVFLGDFAFYAKYGRS